VFITVPVNPWPNPTSFRANVTPNGTASAAAWTAGADPTASSVFARLNAASPSRMALSAAMIFAIRSSVMPAAAAIFRISAVDWLSAFSSAFPPSSPNAVISARTRLAGSCTRCNDSKILKNCWSTRSPANDLASTPRTRKKSAATSPRPAMPSSITLLIVVSDSTNSRLPSPAFRATAAMPVNCWLVRPNAFAAMPSLACSRMVSRTADAPSPAVATPPSPAASPPSPPPARAASATSRVAAACLASLSSVLNWTTPPRSRGAGGLIRVCRRLVSVTTLAMPRSNCSALAEIRTASDPTAFFATD
jgi:hypothetical protein